MDASHFDFKGKRHLFILVLIKLNPKIVIGSHRHVERGILLNQVALRVEMKRHNIRD